MRVAALWFPDWPVQAARLEQPCPGPLVLARAGQVWVCDAAARAAGVRRGLRVRQAQALCPELEVRAAAPERDGALFAALSDSLDDVASSVEVIRPGLAVVDAAAAGRFHGGEDRAVEMLIDAVARAGVDTAVGVADELATALLAARRGGGTVVPAGRSREFLAGQPVSLLAAEVALGVEPELVQQLGRLGLRRLGELAQLPVGHVATRFGNPGRRAHRIASAAPDRRVAPELPADSLRVSLAPEDPIVRVDAAAFAARQLAARLHDKLAAAGLVCLRLQVAAELAGGARVERVWRTREALSQAAMADRVRWQLDGWLTAARAGQEEAGAGGIVSLELAPLEVERPGTAGLFGQETSGQEARQCIARVQSQLGVDKVLAPQLAGGRGVAERIRFVPYGEKRDPAPQGTWPGRIPLPLPARLGGGLNHPTARLQLVDATGEPVRVTAEAQLSAEPYAARWGKRTFVVAGWAGPWPVDQGWWAGPEGSTGGRVARLQLVAQEPHEDIQRAWLLQWRQAGWRVEAAYF